MPMVTCPSFKVSPVRTSCRDGVDSATQRSCTGLVKTPTLDFESVEVAVEDIVAAVGSRQKMFINGKARATDVMGRKGGVDGLKRSGPVWQEGCSSIV